MARFRWLLFGVVVLVLVGCGETLFEPIPCEETSDCVAPCTTLCVAAGDVVMSNECDANGFCDCLCMPPPGD